MEKEKEKEQGLEWVEAQRIVISEDLVAAAKRQLRFLAAVDRSRWLYEGPALQKAIYRQITEFKLRIQVGSDFEAKQSISEQENTSWKSERKFLKVMRSHGSKHALACMYFVALLAFAALCVRTVYLMRSHNPDPTHENLVRSRAWLSALALDQISQPAGDHANAWSKVSFF